MAGHNLLGQEMGSPDDRRATRVIRNYEISDTEAMTNMEDELNNATFELSRDSSTSSSLVNSEVVSDNEEVMSTKQVRELLEKMELQEDGVGCEREETGCKENLKEDHKKDNETGKTEQKKQTSDKKATKGNAKNGKALASKKAEEPVEDVSNKAPDHVQGEEIKTKRAKRGKKDETDLVKAPNTVTNPGNNELVGKIDKTNNKVPDKVTVPENKSNKQKKGTKGNSNIDEENNTENHAKHLKKENKTQNREIELCDEDNHKNKRGNQQPKTGNMNMVEVGGNNQEKTTVAKTQKQKNEVKEKPTKPQKKNNGKVLEQNTIVDVKTDAHKEVANDVEDKPVRLTRAQSRNAFNELKESNKSVKDPTLEQHTKKNQKKNTKQNKENIMKDGDLKEEVKDAKNEINNPKQKEQEFAENANKEIKAKTKPKDMPKEKVAVKKKENKSTNEGVKTTKRVTRK